MVFQNISLIARGISLREDDDKDLNGHFKNREHNEKEAPLFDPCFKHGNAIFIG
jgi:hypothetical protein